MKIRNYMICINHYAMCVRFHHSALQCFLAQIIFSFEQAGFKMNNYNPKWLINEGHSFRKDEYSSELAYLARNNNILEARILHSTMSWWFIKLHLWSRRYICDMILTFPCVVYNHFSLLQPTIKHKANCKNAMTQILNGVDGSRWHGWLSLTGSLLYFAKSRDNEVTTYFSVNNNANHDDDTLLEIIIVSFMIITELHQDYCLVGLLLGNCVD